MSHTYVMVTTPTRVELLVGTKCSMDVKAARFESIGAPVGEDDCVREGRRRGWGKEPLVGEGASDPR